MSQVSSDKVAPSWLDRTYVQNALREAHSDSSLVITQFDVVPAAEPGAHFMSDLYRIQAEYNTSGRSCPQEISLIAKTKHTSEENSDVGAAADSFDVLSHEILMYKTILPKLIAQLAKAKRDTKLIPRSIKIDADHKCILLEDLSYTSFKMADKKLGLNLAHAKLALETVAELHAAGARLNEVEPGSLQSFSRNAFSTDAFESFFVSQIQACGQAVSKWPGYEVYGDKLMALAPNIMKRGRKLFTAESDHFNTLIHSDFWINNMMFRHNADGTPNKCILIDFQVSCWASPAIDLIYFVNTSLEESVRWQQEEELIRHYHRRLVEALRALEYQGNVPSFEEFWSQYSDKGFNAVTSVCVVLPFILKEAKGNNLMNGEDAENAPYLQPRVNRTLKKLLPVFYQAGLLESI